jgi:hypothetical protein
LHKPEKQSALLRERVLSNAVAPKSIHDLPPLESGGFEARHGFGVQDHVAGGLLIEMLLGDGLMQVWCETHDDITLIWQGPQTEDVEFAQVKSEELNQLWTVAKLCEREKTSTNPTGMGTSILEKSLANDRCSEPCRFRLVTCRPVNDELKLLTYQVDSEYRRSNAAKLTELEALVGERVGTFRSPNGNGHGFWLARASWDEVHCLESVEHRNLTMLSRLLGREDALLFIDQVQELYYRFVAKAHAAAAADWRVSPDDKKIRKDHLFDWFRKAVSTLQFPTTSGGGKSVKGKMEEAGLSPDMIGTALEQRLYYREEVLKPQYLRLTDRKLIEQEVAALLQRLRAQLDAGLLTDRGIDFHNRCLDELSQLRSTLGISPPPLLSFLYGCMYNIADRCLHRFRRISA